MPINLTTLLLMAGFLLYLYVTEFGNCFILIIFPKLQFYSKTFKGFIHMAQCIIIQVCGYYPGYRAVTAVHYQYALIHYLFRQKALNVIIFLLIGGILSN